MSSESHFGLSSEKEPHRRRDDSERNMQQKYYIYTSIDILAKTEPTIIGLNLNETCNKSITQYR